MNQLVRNSLFPLSLLLLAFIFSPNSLSAQNNVGIGTPTPEPTAILELESTDKGFLPPQMTTPQRDAILTPADGLVIFNTTDSTLQIYNGECWLHSYQEDCDDCFFKLTPSSLADTIDRVISDSVQIQLNITQTGGNPQNIAFAVVGTLPGDLVVTFNPNPLFSNGTIDVTFITTPFTPTGTFPIVIQALCGGKVENFIYSLTIEPCYYLPVNNNTNNYVTSTDLYATYPSAPTNSPVCVVVEVLQGVDVSSPTTANPAFTTGSLPAGSKVAIVNNGNIIGKGGDGGIATDPIQGLTGAGEDGGNAIDLQNNATIINNFNIYGGGGGGNAMAFSIGIPVGPVFFGALIGAGGGGGAGGGLGGNIPQIIGLTFYDAGQDGTDGQFGVPGRGGLLLAPISITIGPVNITITPSVKGGDGGAYGAPGTQGSFNVFLSATVIVNIPFVGPVPIPIITNLAIPIPVPIPNSGNGGFAIKRNGNNTNIPDNNYNTSFLKGRVGN